MLNKLLKIGLLLYVVGFMPRAFAEWVDITPSVDVSQSAAALDRTKRVKFSYVTIKNTSEIELEAPFRLKIVDSSIPVVNADGTTSDSSPYLYLTDSIAPQSTKTIRVDFQLSRSALTYTAQLEKEGFILETSDGDVYNPPAESRYIIEASQPYVDGSFIVWFVEGTPLATVEQIAKNINATIQAKSGNVDKYLLIVSKPGLTLDEMQEIVNSLRNISEVSSAVINYITRSSVIDTSSKRTVNPDGSGQYYIEKTGINQVWNWLSSHNKTIGGTKKWIGVIDSVFIDEANENYDAKCLEKS